MLTFLRKIRKSLIASGSGQKYILYAIGEIGLVVIGILIALQINNWNEERKKGEIEKSTLNELILALAQDTANINNAIHRLHLRLDDISAVIKHVESKKPYEPKLDTLFVKAYTFHTATFGKYNKAAFELLQERGTDIISNPLLRRMVVEHYTTTFIENEEWFSNLKQVHALEADRLFDHFKITGDLDRGIAMRSSVYNQLLSNETILYPIHHFKALAITAIFILEQYRNETQDVLEMIKDEINK